MDTSKFSYKDRWTSAMSYNDFRSLVDRLLTEGKATGPHESPDLVHYSELNVTRMKRLDKTTKISEALVTKVKGFNRKPLILTITEGWCGDAAQIVPAMEKFATESGLQSRYVLRDENLELMDRHLTNGGRSIPVMVFLDPETFEPIASWGPRPAPAQKMFTDWKQQPEPRSDANELKKDLQLWYTRDKQVTMQQEWDELLTKIQR